MKSSLFVTLHAVCGTKWTKRALGMTAAAEQLQFVWRTARYIHLAGKPTPADAATAAQHDAALAVELQQLLQLRESILEQLPNEVRGHFSISEQDVHRLAAAAASAAATEGGGTAAVSAISLETIGEALEVISTL